MDPPAPFAVSPGLKRFLKGLWLVFGLFILYGTTIPFHFELQPSAVQPGGEVHFLPLADKRLDAAHAWADMVQNVLLFLPFGYLGFLASKGRRTNLAKGARVAAAGFTLSLSVETLQLFSPERHSSPTDVLTNSLGTILGAWLALKSYAVFAAFLRRPETRRYLEAPAAYPLIVTFVLVMAGAWQPFDFTLVSDQVGLKLAYLRSHALDFAWPGDHGLAGIRYWLFSLALCRFLEGMGRRAPLLEGVLATALLGLLAETGQLLVVSRLPQTQDWLTALLGALAGAATLRFRGWRRHPVFWAGVWTAIIFAGATLHSLHPFRPAGAFQGFNWIPFLPYGERSGFTASVLFLETAIAYFPLGFLFAYLFPSSRRALRWAMLSAATMALWLEIAQAYFHVVHADVTEVLAALAGAVLGHLAGGRGWGAFERLLKESAPVEHR